MRQNCTTYFLVFWLYFFLSADILRVLFACTLTFVRALRAPMLGALCLLWGVFVGCFSLLFGLPFSRFALPADGVGQRLLCYVDYIVWKNGQCGGNF